MEHRVYYEVVSVFSYTFVLYLGREVKIGMSDADSEAQTFNSSCTSADSFLII